MAGIASSLGNISYADYLYLQSISIANPNADPSYGYASLYHNYGVFLHDIGRHNESISYFEKSISIDENLFQSIYNIADYTCRKGSPYNVKEAQVMYEKAMNVIEKIHANDSYWSIKLAQKTSVVPYLSEKLETILNDRCNFVENIKEIINVMLLLPYKNDDLVPNPTNYVGCGTLGYYLIYHGYEDLYVRQLMGTLYFIASNTLLQYQSPYLLHLRESVVNLPESNYTVDSNGEDETLLYLHGYITSLNQCIRVAFLSSFWYRHSVGILLKGVIKNLDRSIYCVTLILIEQINKQDHVTAELVDSLKYKGGKGDSVVMLHGSLKTMREKIASLKIDVLVFGEIGMNQYTYFLSFYRLARRSIVFWGHATTSGLTGISTINSTTNIDQNGDWIGPDYFLSSTLFEKNGPELAQLEYSERLILMDGMTTYFEKPNPPMTYEELGLDLINGNSNPFRLPDKRDFLIYLDSTLDASLPMEFILYGVPQTLYKVRADFDDMLKEILDSRSDFYLVLPQGNDIDMFLYLKERLSSKLGHLAERVIFVRSLNEREFLTLIGVIDIVLDPFPVGGGRSSFEIFSVGTPIICLTSETSILQLTAAMYATMKYNSSTTIDFDGCCIALTKASYIQNAISMGQNEDYRHLVREFILMNNYKLYSNYGVIDEWNKLLTCILILPRPKPRILKYNDIEKFHNTTIDKLITKTNWLLGEFQNVRFSYYEPAILLSKIIIDKRTNSDIYLKIPAKYYSNFINKREMLYSTSFIYEDYNHIEISVNLDIYDDNDWKPQCYLHLKDIAKSLSPIMMLRMCAIAGVAVMRNFQHEYVTVPIEYSNKLVVNLLIKEGDDLGYILRTLHIDLMSLVTKKDYNFDEHHVFAVVEAAGVYLTTNQLPASVMGSEQWVNYREGIGRGFIRWAQSRLNSSAGSIYGLDPLSMSCGGQHSEDHAIATSSITLVISTSKRLYHFLRTMEVLENSLGKLPNSIISRVILVDDNSSEEDRDIMKTAYPNFEFYFKPPQDRGHANTMNKIFDLVKNEYMLYLEDDWKLFDQPVLLDSLASAVLSIKNGDSRSTRDHLFESILFAAMEILNKGDIQQILFNSQSTRACAVGSNCDYETIKFAGWERYALYNNSISIPYSLHEFGILSHLPGRDELLSYGGRTHDFAMWPGLTLNPGLWNVAVIKKMLITCLHGQDVKLFNENDKLFEHRFSSLGYAAGVSIGYLPSILFEHIGDVSAYDSQFKRPWDNEL